MPEIARNRFSSGQLSDARGKAFPPRNGGIGPTTTIRRRVSEFFPVRSFSFIDVTEIWPAAIKWSTS